MSDPIIPSFPLMLLNAGKITWVPFHQWNDRCIYSYKKSRLDCIGSLYHIPAHYRARHHQKPDAKGRWVLLCANEQPLIFADLHRYNFGYQSDLLFVNQVAELNAFGELTWQDAVAVLISGAMLSSGTDVLRVAVVSPQKASDGDLDEYWSWGKEVALHQVNHQIKHLTGASKLELEPKRTLELLPQDWWEKTPGKGIRPQLRYIEMRRKMLDGEAEAKRKKPTQVRRRGLLSRLLIWR